MTALEPGTPFPSVSLYDENGKPADIPWPKGDTLYAFFKTTCPTCELAWPFVERIRELGDGGLAVIAVSQDTPAETRPFNARLGVRVPTLYDPSPWKASDALGLESVPAFLLVDGDGRIRETALGFQKRELERFGELAAERSGRTEPSTGPRVFRPGDSVPEFRPG